MFYFNSVIAGICMLANQQNVDAATLFTKKTSGWMQKKMLDRETKHDGPITTQRIDIRGGAEDTCDKGGNQNNGTTKQLVLVIDVDNTLYSEKDLLVSSFTRVNSPWTCGIESQIVQNTHLFGLNHFNMTSEQCDDLYKKFGATTEGLRRMLPDDKVDEILARFYTEVFDAIDFSCLYGQSSSKSDLASVDVVEETNVRSGYDHAHALQKRRALADLLKSISDSVPVYLASNSPKSHVVRVITGLGLRGVNFAGILSPDSEHFNPSRTPEETVDETIDNQVSFPTKHSPGQFYKHILNRHPITSHQIVLLDDSFYNIQKAETVGIRGILVNGRSSANNYNERTLEEGLAEALGYILPPESSEIQSDGNPRFSFSDVKYLHAKNEVDNNAVDPTLWKQLAESLAARLLKSEDDKLTIVDLGAGMLSMVELFIVGGGSDDREKPSMLSLINDQLKSEHSAGYEPRKLKNIEYFAYESNSNLLEGSRERLFKLGFEEIKPFSFSSASNNTLFGSGGVSNTGVDVIVHLRPFNYQNEIERPQSPDLFIGCCFADLFDPDELVLSLLNFARTSKSGITKQTPPLVYFPITFAGITQFSPSIPAQSSRKNENELIPSDTTAFSFYSNSLSSHGHNLDPQRIVNAIKNHGGSLIGKASSDWNIDPNINNVLWETMVYFFGMSGGPAMAKCQLDASGWIERTRFDRRRIIVSNVDLLFNLLDDFNEHSIDKLNHVSTNQRPDEVVAQEIQFVSPYNVTTTTNIWNVSNSSHLAPDQVEIETSCSLISSGTELKIFKGSFESAALDVNIKGMSEETMQYPLAYGYSLVGKVVACGANVKDGESLIGKLVFAFSPHSTRVIVDRDAIQLVPDGIDAEDAVFMPSVETALSLVHDAHVRIGENVAVYGQGLIGLLVTSIIACQTPWSIASSSPFCSITTFDTFDDRLRISSILGATSALKPISASKAGPFDVSIEASGSPRALQSAIDNTSNNGRIILGSWYGNSDVSLKLGIEFHRSHKTIQTSQVSTIPPALTGQWSKDRRFSLTWALVRSLKPSRLITKRLSLNQAQLAYELLDSGKEIAICFNYDNNTI
ncbi:hypothetical protein ACHAXS_013463 [Conticribra weissflogii]